MNSDQINKRARTILLGLRGCQQRDAVNMLATAISMVVSQSDVATEQLNGLFTVPGNHLLCRRRGGISRIEQDSEVKVFIHSLDRYYTGPEMLDMIKNRFGKERTPSKSSLHRYLQKITFQANRGGK